MTPDLEKIAQDKIRRLAGKADAVIYEVMTQCARDLEQELKTALSIPAPKDGKGNYISSPPWSPPYMRSGNLRSAITARAERKGGGFISLCAGDLDGRTPYSIFLEEGTEKMEPRPFLSALRHKYFWIVSERVKRALRKLEI